MTKTTAEHARTGDSVFYSDGDRAVRTMHNFAASETVSSLPPVEDTPGPVSMTAYPGTCLEIILRIPSFRKRTRRRLRVERIDTGFKDNLCTISKSRTNCFLDIPSRKILYSLLLLYSSDLCNPICAFVLLKEEFLRSKSRAKYLPNNSIAELRTPGCGIVLSMDSLGEKLNFPYRYLYAASVRRVENLTGGLMATESPLFTI